MPDSASPSVETTGEETTAETHIKNYRALLDLVQTAAPTSTVATAMQFMSDAAFTNAVDHAELASSRRVVAECHADFYALSTLRTAVREYVEAKAKREAFPLYLCTEQPMTLGEWEEAMDALHDAEHDAYARLRLLVEEAK